MVRWSASQWVAVFWEGCPFNYPLKEPDPTPSMSQNGHGSVPFTKAPMFEPPPNSGYMLNLSVF